MPGNRRPRSEASKHAAAVAIVTRLERKHKAGEPFTRVERAQISEASRLAIESWDRMEKHTLDPLRKRIRALADAPPPKKKEKKLGEADKPVKKASEPKSQGRKRAHLPKKGRHKVRPT